MDGFKRPVSPQPPRPRVPEPVQPVEPPVQAPQIPALPPIDTELADTNTPLSPKRRKKWPFVLFGIFFGLAVLLIGTYSWYHQQLRPVDTADTSVQRVEVKEGSSFGYVASRLEERGIIRSSLAFRAYAFMQGKQTALKAGTCSFTPADSAGNILDKLTAGCHDFKSVTFYPGATLETSLYAKNNAAKTGNEFKDMSIRASLKTAGYTDAEIDEAFTASYDSPLFVGKPASQNYEGYIFGDTYYVETNATAKDVLKVAFDHMYSIIKESDLEAKFKAQGLTLYQGITLSSIIERELDCEGKPTEERKQRCFGYQQQIARVFYNRLAKSMSLGSDVTSIYASDKLGVPSSVTVDSPYNTRIHPGLTPGPIGTPGKLALLAAAEPAQGDELYFLAGDDGLIYFATTEAGHQANITNHCKQSCGDL